MQFKVTKDSISETLWNSASRITTPSIVCSKNGSTYYIPLFEGNTGNEVTYGDYIYTLGRFTVGSKHAAISRVEANHKPSITVDSYPNRILNDRIPEANSLKFTVYDEDNDNLTVTISCLQNSPTSGSYQNYSWIPIKTYNNVSSGTQISFSGTVLESNASGYNGLDDYVLRISAEDPKGGSTLSSMINIGKLIVDL